MEDYLAWNFTRNGIFTVRSAYHLKMSMKRARTGQHESSNSVNKHKGYMALWESNAPAKAKIHMWRIIRNGLAVGAELFRRRIKSGVFCVACGREETIIHRFWACQHSVQFWQLMRSELGVSVAIPPSSLDSQSALASWILDWFAGASDDEREVLIQAAYGLWLARNEARDGKKIAPPHEVVASVRAHMAEWKLVHAVTARQPVAKTIQKWEPPAEGWIKVNSDGAVSKHGGSGGGGVVLRDHNGAFLAGACHHLPHTADPEAAEVLACRRAVQLAIEHDVRRLHLELDSSSVVQMIKLEAKNMSTVGPWVSDIKELLNSREEFKVSWISRTGNVATHRLAKSTPTQPTGLSIPFPCAPATPLRRAPPYHGGRKGKLAVPERSWLIESERRLASLLALGATEPNSRSPRSASTHLCSHKVLYTPCLLRCCSFRCITMVSEDGDISALLSEPNLPEEQAVTSGSDDFLAAILESIKSNEKEVELSPEEAAWADSCFVQTSELSDVDWGAMTQALLDTLKEPMEGSCDTTEVMHEQGTHVLSEAESHALRVEKHTQDDNVDMEQRGSSDDDEDATEVDEVTHVIRGTDEHGRQMDGYTAKSDDDDELVSSEVLEQAESRDSIFKVWDLDVSFSEDESEPELIKDLKKLLRGNPQEAAYPPPSDAAKALSEINVDELVAGLSNLSLQRTSG